MRDIIVIGAGPTGCHAAYLLAQEGFDVLVLEQKNALSCPPVCTGVIGTEAFERFHLNRDSIQSDVKRFLFVSPSGLELSFSQGRTIAHVVDRGRFDRGLMQRAIGEGADFCYSVSCKDIHVGDVGVEVRTDNCKDAFRAKAAIVATGLNGKLLRRLGLGGPADCTHGVQADVEMEDACDSASIHFGKKNAPGSFAWVVGLRNGTARVGLTARRRAPQFLERFLAALAQKSRIRGIGPMRGKIIPIGCLKRTFKDRLLVVGEAAGIAKTTTHGGIYYGLISSDLAVKTLIEAFRAGDFGSGVMGRYETRWKSELMEEVDTGLVFRKLFSRIPDKMIDGLFEIAVKDGFVDELRSRVKFDWHSRLIHYLAGQPPFGEYMSGLLTSGKTMGFSIRA